MDRMDLFASALRSAAEQVKCNITQFGEDFPLPCTENGVYPVGINTDWTPGLFTGQCWLAYEATGDDRFRAAALRQVDSFARRLAVGENLDHHDLGFLYTPSCVAAWQLTGSETGRQAALEAARRLTKRFQPVGQFIQAWGRCGDPAEYRLIIDCLMNVPLLWWAGRETGDDRYTGMARAHTATAARTLFRPDGSTSHTCYMDPETGAPVRAMVWPPIVRLFAECMPLVQQDQACVSINSTTPAGTLAAYALSAAAMALAGWRMAFWGCGAVMLAAAVLWMLGTPSLRRAVQSGPAAAPVPAAEKEPSGVRLLPVLAGAGLMGLILPAMLHGGLKDGVTSWVPSMIQSNFGVGPAFAAAVSMALPLVNLTGAYGAGWLDRCVFRNEVKTSAALFAGALVCLLALPAAVNYSLPLSVALLAATTALMLGINTMFINVMPVRAGRRAGAAFLSGSLNAITYLGAAIATWGIGAAAQGFGWGAVLALWAVMAGTALAVCLLLARRWGRSAGRLARMPLPEAGGQRQLYAAQRLAADGYLHPSAGRTPGRRPRPWRFAASGRVAWGRGGAGGPRPPDLCGWPPAPGSEEPRRPQYPPAG